MKGAATMKAADMNKYIRSKQGVRRGTASTTRRSSESSQPPTLIDLFAGLGLTAAQQARCFRLVEGKGKDDKGKSLPAMSGAEAIAIVKPTPKQKPGGAMNRYIRRKAGR